MLRVTLAIFALFFVGAQAKYTKLVWSNCNTVALAITIDELDISPMVNLIFKIFKFIFIFVFTF